MFFHFGLRYVTMQFPFNFELESLIMNNEELARSLAEHEKACVEKHQEVLESIVALRGDLESLRGGMVEMRVDMVWIKRALWFMLGWFAAMSIALISIV